MSTISVLIASLEIMKLSYSPDFTALWGPFYQNGASNTVDLVIKMKEFFNNSMPVFLHNE